MPIDPTLDQLANADPAVGLHARVVDLERQLQRMTAWRAPTWIEPAITDYRNNWGQYQGPSSTGWRVAFWRDPSGVVHIVGLVERFGATWNVSETIFVLPAGYRPHTTLLFHVPCAASAVSSARVDISTDGSVRFVQIQGPPCSWIAGNWLSLAPISFPSQPA